jgi:hypothetical protein
LKALALAIAALVAAQPVRAEAPAAPRKTTAKKRPAPKRQQHPELLKAMRHYEELEFEKALAVLKKLAGTPGLAREDRVQVALYTGIVAGQLGDTQQAEASFVRALKEERNAQLPEDASPKIQQIFQAAKDRLYGQPPPPKLTAVASGIPGAGQSSLAVICEGAGVTAVRAHVRPFSGAPWTAVDLVAASGGESVALHQFQGTLMGPPETAVYYVEAFDAEGVVIARAGTRDAPLKQTLVAEPEAPIASAPKAARPVEKPFYKTWWFWTATGVVVAGAAAGTVYLLTRPEPCSTSRGGCLEVVIQ